MAVHINKFQSYAYAYAYAYYNMHLPEYSITFIVLSKYKQLHIEYVVYCS